jgi:hypothetical protein
MVLLGREQQKASLRESPEFDTPSGLVFMQAWASTPLCRDTKEGKGGGAIL